VKISELSNRSGVPVATVKFYLREGLLASGEKSSQNQSSYDETHLARLRLIRAFIEVGGLSVASAKAVLAVMDDESIPFGVAAGIASYALPSGATAVDVPDTEQTGRGDHVLAELMAERGWMVERANPGWALAARVIDDYTALGREDLLAVLPVYADAAMLIADADMQTVVQAGDRQKMTETVVVGTVLGDSLLAGLRRMAHSHASCILFPDNPDNPLPFSKETS
jgi:DNA-binding transcriptional MerR regulator